LLDVGCNDGAYSRMASRLGSSVVAIDSDPVAVGALWAKASEENADILPLVVDIARPNPSFLLRCEGYFDFVSVLGMIDLPLQPLIELGADLTLDMLLIECVGEHEPAFEQACAARFRVVEKTPLSDSRRVLYYLRKRNRNSA